MLRLITVNLMKLSRGGQLVGCRWFSLRPNRRDLVVWASGIVLLKISLMRLLSSLGSMCSLKTLRLRVQVIRSSFICWCWSLTCSNLRSNCTLIAIKEGNRSGSEEIVRDKCHEERFTEGEGKFFGSSARVRLRKRTGYLPCLSQANQGWNYQSIHC